MPKRASRTDFSPKSPAPPPPGAISRGRQRLPALALGAGIGGREVCLLAAIVAELEDGPRSAAELCLTQRRTTGADRPKGEVGPRLALQAAAVQFRATSKLLSGPSMQFKLLLLA